jgi:uncharacterized protein YpmB
MDREIFSKLNSEQKRKYIKWVCQAETINSVTKAELREMLIYECNKLDTLKNSFYKR